MEDDGRPWKFTHTRALLREINGDDMEPAELLDHDGVPNLYSDKATNPNVTVRTALKASVATDVRLARVETEQKSQGAQLDRIERQLQQLLEQHQPPPPAAG